MKCVDCGKEIPDSKWKIRCMDCWKKNKSNGPRAKKFHSGYNNYSSKYSRYNVKNLKPCYCEDYPCCGH